MTLKILVTLVLPRGGVDKLTVVLVDGPCGVLGAHEGAIQRDTVKGQQPLAQQAHSVEPATIHNILSGGPATIHNILAGGPATIHILSGEPATIHNILYQQHTCFRQLFAGMKVLKLFLMMWVLTQKQSDRER